MVIAASQVLNAVRQFLPYKERLRCLAGLMTDLEELLLNVESKWLDISYGELTEIEIRKSLNSLRQFRQKAFNKHFPGKTLPDDRRSQTTVFVLLAASAGTRIISTWSHIRSRCEEMHAVYFAAGNGWQRRVFATLANLSDMTAWSPIMVD